eukprot:s2836_g5.t1
MGASSVCSNEAFLSSLGVPPPAFQDMIKANLDKPVRVGLARQDHQLGPHEFDWAIMDLDDDPGRPLYHKPKDTHVAAANQTQAISKLVWPNWPWIAQAPAATRGTASSSQPGSAEPHYHEGLTVIVCGSWNATRNRINAEMLATRDLVDATTLRATLLAACYHTAGSAHTAQLIGGPLLRQPFPRHLVQTYIHDNMLGPSQMHQACLGAALIDYGGSKETLWPAKLGYGARGRAPPRRRRWHRQKQEAPPAGGSGVGPLGLPSYMLQELHKWQDASSWQIRPNPSNLFLPGSWKQTAHQLTSGLRDTTYFYNSLELKGNDQGRFVF